MELFSARYLPRWAKMTVGANVAAFLVSLIEFRGHTPPLIGHLAAGIITLSILSTVILVGFAPRLPNRHPGERRRFPFDSFYLVLLYVFPLFFMQIWFGKSIPVFALMEGLFLLGFLSGWHHLRRRQSQDAQPEDRNQARSGIARKAGGIFLGILWVAKCCEAGVVVTGGWGQFAPFTGMVLGALSQSFLFQTLALLGFSARGWGRSCPRLFWGVAGLGGILIVCFASPIVTAPWNVAQARPQFEAAFGPDWDAPPEPGMEAWMKTPYDASVLFFGLDWDRGFERKEGMVYKEGEGFRLRYDVLYPKSPECPRRGTIIFIHGGGWIAGDVRMATGLLTHLASQGYVIFDVQYRLMDPKLLDLKRELGREIPWFSKHPWSPPDVVGPYRIPDMIQDIGDFTKTLSDPGTERFGADLSSVIFMGQSAGALLAGVCAFGATNPLFDGVFSPDLRVKGAVLFYPPNDMATMVYRAHPMYATFGLIPGSPEMNPETYAQYTPSSLVNASSPPCLLFHGRLDKMVPIRNSRMIEDSLKRAGITTLLVQATMGGHAYDLAPQHGLLSRYFTERFLSQALASGR